MIDYLYSCQYSQGSRHCSTASSAKQRPALPGLCSQSTWKNIVALRLGSIDIAAFLYRNLLYAFSCGVAQLQWRRTTRMSLELGRSESTCSALHRGLGGLRVFWVPFLSLLGPSKNGAATRPFRLVILRRPCVHKARDVCKVANVMRSLR